jgi:hypothetical protein
VPENKQGSKPDRDFCVVGFDRMQLLVRTWGCEIPQIPDYTISRDSFVRPQTAIQGYTRVQILKNRKTNTTLNIQYQPRPPWLEEAKITIIADDLNGLQRAELEMICSQFRATRLLTVEVAFDFVRASGIDRAFVRAHGHFGKSQPIGGNFYSTLNYGRRKTGKFVRAYDKPALSCYRVELELHSGWLRQHDMLQLADLCKLSDFLVTHISFVRFDWGRLASYLNRQRDSEAEKILWEVRRRRHNLHRALKYLRTVRVCNPHRFLTCLPANDKIKQALDVWLHIWGCSDAL